MSVRGLFALEFDRRVIEARSWFSSSPQAATERVPAKGATRVGCGRPGISATACAACAAALLVTGWAGKASRMVTGRFDSAVSGCVRFGWHLLRHTLGRVRRGVFTFDIDLLMLIAAVGAAALAKVGRGCISSRTFAFAHALEHYAMDRARGAIRALSEPHACTGTGATQWDGREVPVEQVQ